MTAIAAVIGCGQVTGCAMRVDKYAYFGIMLIEAG